MPRRQRKVRGEIAQLGRPVPEETNRLIITKLRRRLPIAHCRAELGWPSSLDKFTKIIVDRKIGSNGKKRSRSGLRLWQYCAAGELDIGERRLKLMDDAVPGTRAIAEHAFLDLLGEQSFGHERLLQVIRKLPPKIIPLLLQPTDVHIGPADVRKDIGEDAFYAVQSLGTLDAVAGLLAYAQLCEEKAESLSVGLAQISACAAAHTFSWLTLKHQFALYAEDIWRLMRERYLNHLAPDAFLSRIARLEQYKRILALYEQEGVIKPAWEDRVGLLSIVDRQNFKKIVGLVDEVLQRTTDASGSRISSTPPLYIVASTYYQCFASATSENHEWSVREMRIRKANDLIAGFNGISRRDDPPDHREHTKLVEGPDHERYSR